MTTLQARPAQYRFSHEVPTLGLGMNDLIVSGSGGWVFWVPFQYVVVPPRRNETPARRTKNLSAKAERSSLSSGVPQGGIEEIPFFNVADLPLWQEEESVNVVRSLTKEDRARLHVNTFLGEVYSLSKIGDTDAAGLEIFDFLDRVLLDGFFAVCDEVLSRVDVEKLDTKLTRSFLSITLPAKRKLPSRRVLYQQIEKQMISLRGEEKTRRIIGSLA